MKIKNRKDHGRANPGSTKDKGVHGCLRKTWPRSNHFRKALRAAQRVKHWPNLRHDDAACGAWGTWRIPASGIASSKARVTCAKCRRICGLDGGIDQRSCIDARARKQRNAKAAERRAKKQAHNQAQDIVSWWYVTYGPDDTDQLVEMIAAALLEKK